MESYTSLSVIDAGIPWTTTRTGEEVPYGHQFPVESLQMARSECRRSGESVPRLAFDWDTIPAKGVGELIPSVSLASPERRE